MAQAIVDQGTLNRLRASVVITNFPSLNVISSYLGTEGIRLAFDSNATDLLNTMTGMVTSPTPYQSCTLTMAIVKSTPLSDLFKQQFEDTTIMGLVTVWPDAVTLSPYNLENMALENVREMMFNGTEAVCVITMRGFYRVNQGFFN
jgi:hypothetical protein